MSDEPADLATLLDEMIAAAHHDLVMGIAMEYNEMLWGVPCGPTLTMVHPPQFRGLKDLAYGYGRTDHRITQQDVDNVPVEVAMFWRSLEPEPVAGVIDLEAVIAWMDAQQVKPRPVEPVLLSPRQYEWWKANGWGSHPPAG